MIKVSIHQKDNNSKHGKQKLREPKDEINKSTTIIGYHNILLSEIDRINKQKISKAMEDFINMLNKYNLLSCNRH